jgi:hypothetical protein
MNKRKGMNNCIKGFVFLFGLAIFMIGCNHEFSVTKMAGVYQQENDSNIKLVLSRDNFYFKDPLNGGLSLYSCCDTITEGQWTVDKDYIRLSTPDLHKTTLSLTVKESENFMKDSFYFRINNPLEQFYSDNKVKRRDIYYRVSITDISGSLMDSWIAEYYSNLISIPKYKNRAIGKLSISIYLAYNLNLRNIGVKHLSTVDYKVLDVGSNVFDIRIDELSLKYLAYLRLDNDFVKIYNKNKLEWDGKYYVRTKE